MTKTVKEFIEEDKFKELFETSWGLNNIILEYAQINNKRKNYEKGLIDEHTYKTFVTTIKNFLIKEYGNVKIEI